MFVKGATRVKIIYLLKPDLTAKSILTAKTNFNDKSKVFGIKLVLVIEIGFNLTDIIMR